MLTCQEEQGGPSSPFLGAAVRFPALLIISHGIDIYKYIFYIMYTHELTYVDAPPPKPGVMHRDVKAENILSAKDAQVGG
jgi:serine/threonine protein kinase